MYLLYICEYDNYFTHAAMKKMFLSIALGLFAACAYAQVSEQPAAAECDSINVPVFLVDGVEAQNFGDLRRVDIVSMKVVKDPAITSIFKPRLGGVVLITTKSKPLLTPLLKIHEEQQKQQKEQRIDGQLMIR